MTKFSITKIIFSAIVFFCLFGLVENSWAAEHYVREGASGSANGSDWENAYVALPSTLIRGDIYYIADGSYGSYTFDDPIQGEQYIIVKKAIISDHGTDVGWLNEYGDGMAEWEPTIMFKTDYIIFDGVTGGGPGSWNAGYGFKISSDENIIFVMFSNKYGAPADRVDVSNIQISHIELAGRTPVSPGWADGFSATTYEAHTSNVVVSHCYTHDIGGVHFKWYDVSNIMVEYCYAARNASSNDHHGTAFRMDAASDVTLKHSIFEDMVGTGFVGGYDIGIDSAKIFGNSFWWSPGFHGETNSVPPGGYGNGVIYSVGASGPVTNWRIYNNSFVNLPDKPVINLYNTGSGNVAYNNLFDTIAGNKPVVCGSVTGENPNCIYDTISHDYSYLSNTDRTSTEIHSQNGGAISPFVDWQSMDFRLNTPALYGFNLGMPYDADAYGNTRGEDGIWDIGAYEYVPPADTTAPAAPSGLSVM